MEAGYGLTDIAMRAGSNNARYANDDSLFVKFFRHPRLNRSASEAEGRPIYVETDYIEIRQPGNKTSVICRPASQMDKERFPEHWKKYEARITEEHVEGTRLEEWPGITRSQVEELRFFNVRTVEQLVSMSDNNGRNIMGFNMLKQKAKEFLDLADKEAIKKRDEHIASLEARLAALEAGDQAEEAEEADDVEEEYYEEGEEEEAEA